jgi:hypothetical protein
MDKDKALSIALELIEYEEKNPLFSGVPDEELSKALLGGMLSLAHSGGDKTIACTTLEIAREIIRRFQPKAESVEVPVEHI